MTTPTPDHPTQLPAVPEELYRQWRNDNHLDALADEWLRVHIDRAAAWAWAQREEDVREAEQRGAATQLQTCVEWVRDYLHQPNTANAMREDCSRRPAPPTLREQALAILADDNRNRLSMEDVALIREALQDGADG
jgi:hypothetical protein